MDLIFSSPCSVFVSLILLFISRGISAATFTLINRCDYTVWPGILGNTRLDSTGFELPPGGSRSFNAPSGWSGRFWGRTGCNFEASSGQGSCATADCGSNQVECNGAGATPPATLAEFTLGSNTQDFYDVSLVDGYNLPMLVEASGGSGACGTTGCVSDLNRSCPAELRSGGGGACRSACEAFGTPEYCCSGSYGTPSTCKPSIYSELFKSACPRSYSYAYDDATSTFTCSGGDYRITFCPSLTSQKSSRDSSSSPPQTVAGTTPGSPATEATNGLGSGFESPNSPGLGIDSWLPNFATGDSSKTIPSPRFSIQLWTLILITLPLIV